MKKLYLGTLLGIVAGIIDTIPMFLQGLTWDAILSAFSLWVVLGLLISSVDIGLRGAPKGLAISFLVFMPTAILIGWKSPYTLIPIIIMTFILSSMLGYLTERFGK